MMKVREMTGMSQETFASMLCVSRSSLAMSESTGRDLPGDAFLYHAAILREMQAENQAAVAPDNINAARQQWKKELTHIAAERRYEAIRLKQHIDAYTLKENQRRNRLLLAHCVEKAQAWLKAQSEGTPWQPVTEWHVRWLELEKSFTGNYLFNETAYCQHLRNQFRYQMLLKEAEEAERLAGGD